MESREIHEARFLLPVSIMQKKSLYAMVVILALTFAATLSAQQPPVAEPTMADVWKHAVGKRGTIQHTDGSCEYVYTVEDKGEMVIVFVGQDYVDFARFTTEKGERLTHRLIPMSKLVMRRSRLTQ
ncbi:MAG TPA: hypothetical protein VHW00_06180 [Thermoanaerobaculia bacterium]|nr:hypothetical protein [Thermoanaerobaculia bacterium]